MSHASMRRVRAWTGGRGTSGVAVSAVAASCMHSPPALKSTHAFSSATERCRAGWPLNESYLS